MVYIGASSGSDSESSVASSVSAKRSQRSRKPTKKGKERLREQSASDSASGSEESGSDEQQDSEMDEDAPPPVSRLDQEDSDDDMSDAQDTSYIPKRNSDRASRDQSTSQSPESNDSALGSDQEEPSRRSNSSRSRSRSMTQEADDTFAELPSRKQQKQDEPAPKPQNLPTFSDRDAGRSRVMQASLFARKPDTASPKKLNIFSNAAQLKNTPALTFAPSPAKSFPVQSVAPSEAQLPASKAVAVPKQRKLRPFRKIPELQTCIAGKEGMLADSALMLGKSFRPSWTPDGKLVHLGTIGGTHAEVYVLN